MRNTYKYTRLYSGAEPEFVEGDVFRTVIPLSEAATATVGPAFGKTGETVRKPLRGDNRILNVGLSPKQS